MDVFNRTGFKLWGKSSSPCCSLVGSPFLEHRCFLFILLPLYSTPSIFILSICFVFHAQFRLTSISQQAPRLLPGSGWKDRSGCFALKLLLPVPCGCGGDGGANEDLCHRKGIHLHTTSNDPTADGVFKLFLVALKWLALI